jgi:hypothetical protein
MFTVHNTMNPQGHSMKEDDMLPEICPRIQGSVRASILTGQKPSPLRSDNSHGPHGQQQNTYKMPTTRINVTMLNILKEITDSNLQRPF